MPAIDMPPAEVDIDPDLVTALLRQQFPDLAALPLAWMAEGWDNVVYRLGDDFVVRLPRREVAVALTDHEQRWLPILAERLPLPIPAPILCGKPSERYPWPWSVCHHLPGVPAATEPPEDPHAAAETLGRFLAALHQPAPADAPANPVRGIPLSERAALTERTITSIEDMLDDDDVAAVRQRWADALDAPPWPGPPVWLHGDLHPANILVDAGRISAVIDFGDLTAGDPATDLATAWLSLPTGVRTTFRHAAGDPDDDTWRRARGWALSIGTACMAHSADTPMIGRLGRRAVEAVLHDESS